MKSNAPWSVKGIERDARETAKEAARREGMTVGEWLNQMIYSQAEGGDGALSDAEVEGLKLRDIVTAIEHLRNRVVEAESKNAAAVADLSRNMGGFVERMQRLERIKPAEGSYEDVAQRIEKLERAGGDRGRIDALKALEKAVTQVAVQFNNAQRTTLTRLDSAEAQLQEFAERIDRVGEGGAGEPAELSPLKSAIENLAERVAKAERIAQEAAALKTEAADSSDPEFVERTGARLRVLGDEIKRGGDQIRALEGTIAKLSGQIEAAEKRSADGVQKVTETIAEVRTQLVAEEKNNAPDVEAVLAAARAETEDKLEALHRSLQEINARFETLGRNETPAPEAPAAIEVMEMAPAAEAEPEPAASDSEDINDVVDEIEEAVAAMEAEDDSAEEDPFAFADDTDTSAEAEEAEPLDAEADDEPADDFSFQIDDETQDASTQGEGEDDILVSADEGEDDGGAMNDAESLLAEVRSALTGEGLEDDGDEEDDELGAAETETPTGAVSEDDEEDEQAPNTASLAASMAIDTDSSSEEEPSAPAPKEDMLQAARRRAREAASQGEDGRPRRSQLTAKQRAILAARARQKRAAEEGHDDTSMDSHPEPAAQHAPAEDSAESLTFAETEAALEEEEAAKSGRFGKFAAALASAKARLGRNKDDDADEHLAPKAKASSVEEDDFETRRGNGDRAALDTLKSTSSAKPLTIALGIAILLALAALVYLMKDFVLKPDAGANAPTPAIARTETPAEAAQETTSTLPSVPEAPATDPQALYVESMDALAAATSESGAKSAIAKLQDAAALGYPPAQLQLGELYKTGQGVEQDLGQARLWFRRAANGGNVLAMHRIGVMTARGDGGPADSQEAIAWFERAANFGLVDSQYNLGAIYHPSEDGGSSVQDAAKAYYWYSLAAANGDAQAQPLAAGVAVALSPETRSEIDADVSAWTAEQPDEAANLNAAG
ncbi:hypothetical protein ACFOOP_08340 [Marinicaulis aureus]|uniref:Sel1 repeat family protein n=1 Tax=Hyphococcus aureus TaxID=2666033 RepID=A0ABW1KU81_9PROT